MPVYAHTFTYALHTQCLVYMFYGLSPFYCPALLELHPSSSEASRQLSGCPGYKCLDNSQQNSRQPCRTRGVITTAKLSVGVLLVALCPI